MIVPTDGVQDKISSHVATEKGLISPPLRVLNYKDILFVVKILFGNGVIAAKM